MRNYLCFNGKKIELNEEQMAKIREQFAQKKRLGDVAVGELAKIGEREYIVLKHDDGNGTWLLMRDFLDTMKFGETCDFSTSYVRKKLDKFAEELAKVVGKENIYVHDVDLTADDGLKCYGTVGARVSLITCDLYREFVEIIDKYRVDDWWWTATPLTTAKHNCTTAVKCVSPSGYVNNIYNSNYFSYGVRPFLNFVSSIFVS